MFRNESNLKNELVKLLNENGYAVDAVNLDYVFDSTLTKDAVVVTIKGYQWPVNTIVHPVPVSI